MEVSLDLKDSCFFPKTKFIFWLKCASGGISTALSGDGGTLLLDAAVKRVDKAELAKSERLKSGHDEGRVTKRPHGVASFIIQGKKLLSP